MTPIRQNFGYGWGQCIDRYYIERFLARQARDIQGRVLEIGDNSYTQRFGGSRITSIVNAGPPTAIATANAVIR